MTTGILVFLLTLSPILVVGVLLELAAWRDRRRQAAIARQIALTDALAWELGAIVAPVVTPALWGPWKVRIPVPFSRPLTVARILAIAHRSLARIPDPYEIVLVSQEEPVRPRGRVSAIAPAHARMA
jgi:hypothetical protein